MAWAAAEYLFHEISQDDDFVISREAYQLHESFRQHLKTPGSNRGQLEDKFKASVDKLANDPVGRFELIRSWVRAFRNDISQRNVISTDEYVDEAAVLLFYGAFERRFVLDVSVTREMSGLSGDHSLLNKGAYTLNYHAFMRKLDEYAAVTAPAFRAYHAHKRRLTEEFRADIRVEEFMPRVLTSFVRNQLIDKVYLPLIGDNLAKQIGAVGDNKRTDRMGLLLLISPPGYGKTTLMEYVANRLGLIFMKINGPTIGHKVTSLDPNEAPNTAAREEVDKLNLALEMGDNVMIYVDDIQHTNPEFLQKFISLCDATRRIEGVWHGKTRTYDLRGKKVCVVMAGNPYTESGEKFKIPDMLANRADTFNLGDIIGNTYDTFVLSYLENCLTSNPALNKLATRSQKDVYSFVKMAELGMKEGLEFEANYAIEEMNEIVNVLKKLIVVRDIMLKVNQQYIASAAQADEFRTEPRFQLQGSYRNMNKIAEKVLPIMNDAELQTLILSHYEQESQTLTTGAEANMLKFKELVGIQNEKEAARWADIKKTFQRNQYLRGMDASDPTAQVVAQLSAVGDGLSNIRDSLKNESLRQSVDQLRQTIEQAMKAREEEGKKVVVVRRKE